MDGVFTVDEIFSGQASPRRDSGRKGDILRGIAVNKKLTSVTTPDLLAPTLKAEVPGIARSARIMPFWGKPVLQFEEKQFFHKGYFTENGLRDMFSYPVASGDAASALDGPAKIVLTKSLAVKYFSRQDAIEKTMIFKDMSRAHSLTVTAVLDDVPENSHLRFDYLISLDTLRSDEGFSGWAEYS